MFDPLSAVPAIIAVAVGLLVWLRHRLDRRARLFLALALAELAFSAPAVLFELGFEPINPVTSALVNGMMMTIGIVSAALFLHFGLAFPHARPWLRQGRMRGVYLAAIFVGLVPLALILSGSESPRTNDMLIGGVVILVGPLAILAAVAGCVSIYRSFREMTAAERAAYRVPVMGVLAGMAASVLIDVFLGLVMSLDDRLMVLTGNALATATALLFPLFFFMAARKYRLLERHAQDYVSLSDTAPRRSPAPRRQS
ncbi:MAG: hypothetical protein M3R55_05065 [Acidobacteriota bacterium]|nr:hypothetical protein [Acidobacteriota bacterium]